MIVAIWVIAVCEVIRALQNLIQIRTTKKVYDRDEKRMQTALEEFRRICKKFE